MYKSKVVSGNKLGREIGFPTINVSLESLDLDFEFGVYSCHVVVDNQKRLAAMHYGPKKTIDNIVSLEFHILDYNDFNYKFEFLEFEVLKFIRPLVKFSSLIELQKQINLDLLKIKSLHG